MVEKIRGRIRHKESTQFHLIVEHAKAMMRLQQLMVDAYNSCGLTLSSREAQLIQQRVLNSMVANCNEKGWNLSELVSKVENSIRKLATLISTLHTRPQAQADALITEFLLQAWE